MFNDFTSSPYPCTLCFCHYRFPLLSSSWSSLYLIFLFSLVIPSTLSLSSPLLPPPPPPDVGQRLVDRLPQSTANYHATRRTVDYKLQRIQDLCFHIQLDRQFTSFDLVMCLLLPSLISVDLFKSDGREKVVGRLQPVVLKSPFS